MIALLLCIAVAAQDVDAQIEKLKDDSIEIRAAATAALLKAGPRALPKLRAAVKGAAEGAFLTALKEIVAAVEKAETLSLLKFEVLLPKEAPGLAAVNSGKAEFTIRITNSGPREVTIPTGIECSVSDAKGAAIDTSRAIGKFGLRDEGCFLNGFAFQAIAAGKSVDLSFVLSDYDHDPVMMVGWTLPKAGDYTLTLKAGFDRSAFKKTCPDTCTDHDESAKAWNRAIEFENTFTAKVTVTE